MKGYILLVILVLVGCEKIEFDEDILIENFRRYQELSFNQQGTEAYLIYWCGFCSPTGGETVDSIIFRLESSYPSLIIDRRLWYNQNQYVGKPRIKDAVIKHWDTDSLIVGTFKLKWSNRLRENWIDFPFIWEKP